MIKQTTITAEKLSKTSKEDYHSRLQKLGINKNLEEIVFKIEPGAARDYLTEFNKLIPYDNLNSWPERLKLNFNKCYLTDENAELISKLLTTSTITQVTSLNFDNNNFTDEIINKLQTYLSNKCELERLSLKGTQISASGLQTLAEIVTINNRLTSVVVDEELKKQETYDTLNLLLKITRFFNTHKNKLFTVDYAQFIKAHDLLTKKNNLIYLKIQNIDEQADSNDLNKFLKEQPVLKQIFISDSKLTTTQLIYFYQNFLKNSQLTTFMIQDSVEISGSFKPIIANSDSDDDVFITDDDESHVEILSNSNKTEIQVTPESNQDIEFYEVFNEDEDTNSNEQNISQSETLAAIFENLLVGKMLTLQRPNTEATKITLIIKKNKEITFYFPMDIIKVAAIAINSNQAFDINLQNQELSTEHLHELLQKLDFEKIKDSPHIDLRNNNISLNDQAEPIVKFLIQAKSSISIDLDNNPIDAKNLKVLYETLLQDTSLETRSIFKSKWDDYGFIFKINNTAEITIRLPYKIEYASSLIASSNAIHTFSYHECTDKSLDILIEQGLKNNKSLTALKLINSRLTSSGVNKLAELIKTNHGSLAHLDLSYSSHALENRLNSASITSLILALETNTRLISLNLQNSAVDNSILENLKNPLAKNRTLISINLENGLIAYNTYNNNKLGHVTCFEYSITYDVIINFIKYLDSKAMKNNHNLLDLTFYISQRNFPTELTKKYDSLKKKPQEPLNKYLATNKAKRNTFINHIIDDNRTEVEKSLKEVSLYAIDSNDNYPLHLAIEKGHLDLVQFFISQNYNLYLTNKNGKTALEFAQEMADKNVDDNRFIEIKKAIKQKLNLQSQQKKITPKKKTTTTNKKATSQKRKASSTSHEEEPAAKKRKQDHGKSTEVINESSDFDSQVMIDEPSNEESSSQIASASSSVLSDGVFDYVANGNIYQLKRHLNKDNVNSYDENRHSLLYVAAEQGQLEAVRLLLAQGADPNLHSGKLPIAAVIKRITTQQSANPQDLLVASLLVRHGAKIANTVLLHRVVQAGHYRLMKILLAAPDCEVNSLNKKSKTNKNSGLTALDIAVDRQDKLMVERLSIDRRLTQITISNAIERAKKLPANPNNVAIIQALKQRLVQKVPIVKPGIQWLSHAHTFFGAQTAKPKKQVHIDSQKALASLALKHTHTKQLLKASAEKIDISDNPVTASLVFVVSKAVYRPQQVEERTKIRIELNFKDEHHLTSSNVAQKLEEEFEKILQRAKAAPSSIFEETTFTQRKNKLALSADEIKEKYLPYIQGEDAGLKVDYDQKFHHGEQSLLDDIENTETIASIVKKLMEHKKFVNGCKVYAVVLELYSPRYPCVNCEAAVLGEQNSDSSRFLKNLAEKLQEYRCALPQLSPLRMVTIVSSHRPCDSENISEEEHEALKLDIRSIYRNDIILARDESAFKSEITLYHSSAAKLNL